MTSYAFETITPEEALGIQTGDYLTLAGGPASRASVLYLAADADKPARIQVSIDGRTVVFGTNIADITLRGAFEVRDGSRLVIGDEDHQTVGGSPFADAVFLGEGHDLVRAGGGDDLVQGNAGNDTLHGDAGANTVYGGQGNDVIYSGGADEVRGSWAHGNKGDDTVVGSGGHDVLYGGQGNDSLVGGASDDLLFGDLGNDTIDARTGFDSVLGGAGDDRILLSGLEGAVVGGGDGADTFEVLSPGELATVRPLVTVTDWDSSDRLRFVQVNTAAGRGGLASVVADSYEAGLELANQQMRSGARYVAAQVGTDVYVFAETDEDPEDGADAAVLLVGRSLADVGAFSFI